MNWCVLPNQRGPVSSPICHRITYSHQNVVGNRGETESGEYAKAMFELSHSMEWTRLEQSLQIEHFGPPLAIPIPDEIVSKQD